MWRVREREELRWHLRFHPEQLKYEVAINWDGRVCREKWATVVYEIPGFLNSICYSINFAFIHCYCLSPDSEPIVFVIPSILSYLGPPDSQPDYYSQPINIFKSHPHPKSFCGHCRPLKLLPILLLVLVNFWKRYFLFAVSTFLSISQPITLSPTPLLPLCQGFQWVLKTHKPTCLSPILNLFVYSVAGSAIHHLSPQKSLFFHGFPETTLSFISFYFLIILSPWLASLPLFFPYTTCLLPDLFLFSPHSRALHDLIYLPPSTIILISHHLSSFLNPSHGVRLCSWTSVSIFTKLTQSKAYPLSPPTSSLLLSLYRA